jgi:hypothetical protein
MLDARISALGCCGDEGNGDVDLVAQSIERGVEYSEPKRIKPMTSSVTSS